MARRRVACAVTAPFRAAPARLGRGRRQGEDMVFWIIAAGLALVAAATLVAPLWRGTGAPMQARNDMAVYRDQLAEVDRDIARGVLAEDEAARTRTEVARRLLAADKAGAETLTEAPQRISRALAVTLVVLMVALSGGLYWWLGAPGYPDMPSAERLAHAAQMLKDRPDQSQAEAGFVAPSTAQIPADQMALIDQLRQVVPTRPDDRQGWTLLSQQEANVGNFPAAARAQAHLLSLEGATPDLADMARLADLMVAAAGGEVSPQAEGLIKGILARDPTNITANYYLGLMYGQTDRPDIAFRLWKKIIDTGQPTEPHIAVALTQIGTAADLAGITYTPPQTAPGPSAGDVAAAGQMNAADRTAMIKTMVAGLGKRLNADGGTPQEWARLITSYAVLGQAEDARAAWDKAKAAFAGKPSALDTLANAAQGAGIAP